MGQSQSVEPCTKPTAKKELRHVIILITGLGGNKGDKYDKIIKAYNSNPIKKQYGYKMTRCDNDEEIEIYSNILKSVCKIDLDGKPESNKYVAKVLRTVKNAIKSNVDISVIGYSYGGSIVERVIKEGNLKKYMEKVNFDKSLEFNTFGNINISVEPSKDYKVHHYLFKEDWAALQCNHISPNNNYPHITWLNTHNYFEKNELNKNKNLQLGIFVHQNYPLHIVYPKV